MVAAVSNLVSYANFRRTHPTSTHSTGKCLAPTARCFSTTRVCVIVKE